MKAFPSEVGRENANCICSRCAETFPEGMGELGIVRNNRERIYTKLSLIYNKMSIDSFRKEHFSWYTYQWCKPTLLQQLESFCQQLNITLNFCICV